MQYSQSDSSLCPTMRRLAGDCKHAPPCSAMPKETLVELRLASPRMQDPHLSLASNKTVSASHEPRTPMSLREAGAVRQSHAMITTRADGVSRSVIAWMSRQDRVVGCKGAGVTEANHPSVRESVRLCVGQSSGALLTLVLFGQ